MSLVFQRASRNAVKLKLGMMGPSGSGKTFSSLVLGEGLIGPDGRIAYVDTENGSASLYADQFDFDVINMHEPFYVQKFLDVIEAAVDAKYDLLIIDSISAEWQQLLVEKEMLDLRGGNTWANFAPITKKHEEFKKAFLQAPIHIIACMRSHQKYLLQENDKGKSVPIKAGVGPIQREGFEYECSVVFDIDMNHNAKTSKDRSGLFCDDIFRITKKTGQILADWLQRGGKPTEEILTEPAPEPIAPPAIEAENPPAEPEPNEEWLNALQDLKAAALRVPDVSLDKANEMVDAWTNNGPAALPSLLSAISALRARIPSETIPEGIAKAADESRRSKLYISDSEWIQFQELVQDHLRPKLLAQLENYLKTRDGVLQPGLHGEDPALRWIAPEHHKKMVEIFDDQTRRHGLVTWLDQNYPVAS